LKALARICIGLLLLIGFLLPGYAFFIEPFWLEVTHYQVYAPIYHLKIAHLSDLHISQIGKLEKSVEQTLRKEAPDLIVITGDVFSGSDETQIVRTFISQLDAPLGVWMVDGNWDHWTLPDAGLRNLARTSDAVLLRNQNRRVREDLWLVGLDDALAGKPELEPAFLGVPKNAPCIALFHSPEFFPKIEGRCFLNLAGHTHGGQIRLPGLGPLWLPPGSGRYIAGWYGTDASKLYVSKGVGTSLLRARLFARPEIAIFTIGDGK
jgi:predicted MPP superfamily phosphohydrolase